MICYQLIRGCTDLINGSKDARYAHIHARTAIMFYTALLVHEHNLGRLCFEAFKQGARNIILIPTFNAFY
jgi:hypothetical protein